MNRSKQIDFFDAKSNTRNKKLLGARASLLISNATRSKDAISKSLTITVFEGGLLCWKRFHCSFRCQAVANLGLANDGISGSASRLVKLN